MGIDYGACLMHSRVTGEALSFSYSEYNREAVLAQLWERLEAQERGSEAYYMREENASGDMLWLLCNDEIVEKGIYSWNRPDVDLAIVAPPALMALIMGEYELAVRLSEQDGTPMWKNRVEELYQEGKRAGIGGSSYTFGEACLLSGEMSLAQKLYFWKKGYYDAGRLAMEENYMLLGMEFQQHSKTISNDIWRPIEEIRALGEILEDVKDLLALAVGYALRMEFDLRYEDFWDVMYQMFPEKEEHQVIVDALHGCFLNECGTNDLPPRFENRLTEGVKVYFNYEDAILMTGAVEQYVLGRIASKTCISGKRRPYLERYFDAVGQFEGAVSLGWHQGMLTLLQSRDSEWLSRGFQNGFFKREYISDYIEILLEEHMRGGHGYSKYISRLIQMKWQKEIM